VRLRDRRPAVQVSVQGDGTWDEREIHSSDTGDSLTNYFCSSRAQNPEDEERKVSELKEWAKQQVRDYLAGRLSRRQIRILESLPGWAWDEAAIEEQCPDVTEATPDR
jgi:hypothetical protein